MSVTTDSTTDAPESTYTPERPKLLKTAAGVTDRVLKVAVDVEEGWFGNADRIDWEEFIDRLAGYLMSEPVPMDIDDYDNAAVWKIKRHVQALRRAG